MHSISKNKKIVLVIVWVLVIWGHSLLQGPQSSAESGLLVSVLHPLFETFGVTRTDQISFIIRKTAHFSEYAILALLLWWTFAAEAKRSSHFIGFMLVPVVVASLDETLQLFVPGRSGAVRDVVLDCSGALLAFLICAAVRRIQYVSKQIPTLRNK